MSSSSDINLLPERVREWIAHQRLLLPEQSMLVAVSGGADSVCLLHLVRRIHKEKSWTPVVVHIQHHLRGKESLEDQKFVEALARTGQGKLAEQQYQKLITPVLDRLPDGLDEVLLPIIESANKAESIYGAPVQQ